MSHDSSKSPHQQTADGIFASAGFRPRASQAAAIGAAAAQTAPQQVESGIDAFIASYAADALGAAAEQSEPASESFEAPAPLPPVAPQATSLANPPRPGRDFLRIAGSSQAISALEAAVGMPIASVAGGEPRRFAFHRGDGHEVRAFTFPPSFDHASLQSLVGALGDGRVTVSIGPIRRRAFQVEGGTWRQDAREPTQMSAELAAALQRVRK
jgi:hypothetical protein